MAQVANEVVASNAPARNTFKLLLSASSGASDLNCRHSPLPAGRAASTASVSRSKLAKSSLDWAMPRVMSRREMLDVLAGHFGAITPVIEESSAPADRYTLPDGTTFGIISSTTEPFCESCDRSRLTADGLWYLCLYAAHGTDLRRPLRAGASAEHLAQLIRATWEVRSDRGAEERLASRDRSPLIPVDRLKRDPHLEMHTRGG